MNGMESLARMLIFAGILLALFGLGLWLAARLGGAGFRLPGDFIIRRGNFTLYFPLATGIILSLVLTIILNLFLRR